MSIYSKLMFPSVKNRTFFYTNFVETVDGKVTVTSDPGAYWPLGSPTDRATLVELRSYADALIHGATTASGHRTLDSITKPEFQKMREKHQKSPALPYFVLSSHPDLGILESLTGAADTPIYLVTTNEAQVPPALEAIARILRFGTNQVNLKKLAMFLHEEGYKHVLMEGGPHVFGSFFAEDLIDELFVTITPKIFGNKDNNTLTMVEGHLFDAKHVKHLELLSVKQHQDELFLRYRVKR